MVLPNLIHAVDVVIHPINRGATVYDRNFREPVQQAARATTVIVKGQPNKSIMTLALRQDGASGPIEGEDGYVLFRLVDLVAKGITRLQQNDRISKIGNVEVDFYIERVTFSGTYPDQGGATLCKAFARDRKPAKKAGA